MLGEAGKKKATLRGSVAEWTVKDCARCQAYVVPSCPHSPSLMYSFTLRLSYRCF